MVLSEGNSCCPTACVIIWWREGKARLWMFGGKGLLVLRSAAAKGKQETKISEDVWQIMGVRRMWGEGKDEIRGCEWRWQRVVS